MKLSRRQIIALITLGLLNGLIVIVALSLLSTPATLPDNSLDPASNIALAASTTPPASPLPAPAKQAPTKQPSTPWPVTPWAAPTRSVMPTPAISPTPCTADWCNVLGVQAAPIDATPEGPTTPPGYGLQIHGCGSLQPDRALFMTQQAGFDWVKQQVRWDEIEGVRNVYAWRCVDDVVRLAEPYGLNILLSINTVPKWARNDDGSPNATYFAAFAAAVAQRYKGRIQAIEVFNEPNLFIEWNARLNPAGYAQLLAAASTRIRQIDPNILIISAGLAPTRWNDWGAALDDLKFMQQIAGTVSRSADCVGVHYNDGHSSPLDSGSPFEQLVTQYHTLTGLRVCLTEFGIAAPITGQKPPAGFEWSANTTEGDAARWLAEGVRWTQLHPDVMRLIVVWNFNYYSSLDDSNSLYSLEVGDKLRPAYYALRGVLGK